ncbi:hypothetical protein [Archaeoglobus sp.]
MTPASRVLDPLGIWTDHLYIQDEFTRGITSVTRRARYYTLLSYYFYKRFKKNENISFDRLEKLLILAAVTHHNWNLNAREIQNVFDRFTMSKKWGQGSTFFDLTPRIRNYGYGYYNRQMERLECVWETLDGRTAVTTICGELAEALGEIPLNVLGKDKISTKDVASIQFLCPCTVRKNERERGILEKLFFGFIKRENEGYNEEDWVINYESFEKFMNTGDIELAFKYPPKSKEDFHIMRRGTLLLFLKIIGKTTPPEDEFRRYVWDAVYFLQNRENGEFINYGRLERFRYYWEILHLNIYYVYALEKLLEAVQHAVEKQGSVTRDELFVMMNIEDNTRALEDKLGLRRGTATLKGISEAILSINKKDRTDLTTEFNEASVYDEFEESSYGDILQWTFLMLSLLSCRLKQVEGDIVRDSTSQLYIKNLLSPAMLNMDLVSFGKKLVNTVIDTHLTVSMLRWSQQNTRNWIFTEEDGVLQYARLRPFEARPRDNRWPSIRSILEDLDFLESSNNRVYLTRRGEEWLSKVEQT